MIENVSTQLTVFHCLCPLPASRKGLRLPLRSALFGEGGRDWRPCYGKIDNYIESLIIIIPVYYFLLDTLNEQCWLILFILNTCKQVLWQEVNTQTSFHQCLLCLLRKINNLQVQIYINLKTVNRFKYKMDYSLVVLSMCVQ